jgi:tetratricopeptide (TPR) repeat protein
LGTLLAENGDWAQASAQFRQAVRCDPQSAEVQNNLGLALVHQGQPREAIEHFDVALHIDPRFAKAHYNWGIALYALGQKSAAKSHFVQALDIKPDYAEAHDHLGVLLADEGKVAPAREHYEQAVRLKPGDPYVCNDLAWLLATHGPEQGDDAARAIALAEEACRRTNRRNPQFLDTLAAAYASAGRFREAVSSAYAALALANQTGQPALAREIEGRLRLYMDGRPFRLPDG